MRIDYSRAVPTASVRVQDLFGLREHPTVASGKVPVALELLSPADRPVQITSDLPGFWAGELGAGAQGDGRPVSQAPLAGGSGGGPTEAPQAVIAVLAVQALVGALLFVAGKRLANWCFLVAALAPLTALIWLLTQLGPVLDGRPVTETIRWIRSSG